jgi:hypothetical protein
MEELVSNPPWQATILCGLRPRSFEQHDFNINHAISLCSTFCEHEDRWRVAVTKITVVTAKGAEPFVSVSVIWDFDEPFFVAPYMEEKVKELALVLGKNLNQDHVTLVTPWRTTVLRIT